MSLQLDCPILGPETLVDVCCHSGEGGLALKACSPCAPADMVLCRCRAGWLPEPSAVSTALIVTGPDGAEPEEAGSVVLGSEEQSLDVCLSSECAC